MPGNSLSNHSASIQGINTSYLDELVLELNNEVDDIGVLLEDIENKISDMKANFKGKAADALFEKFTFYQEQIEKFKINLLSYPKDLLALRNSMLDNEKNLQKAYNEFTEEITKEAKDI